MIYKKTKANKDKQRLVSLDFIYPSPIKERKGTTKINPILCPKYLYIDHDISSLNF